MPIGDGKAHRRVRPAAGIAPRLAAACAAVALYVRWVRPQLLTWGATREEITRGYPGDELIPEADRAEFTMATTLPAPPEEVLAGSRRPDPPGGPHPRPQPPATADGAVSLVLLQPLHFIMQTRQFRNLRVRVGARGRGLS